MGLSSAYRYQEMSSLTLIIATFSSFHPDHVLPALSYSLVIFFTSLVSCLLERKSFQWFQKGSGLYCTVHLCYLTVEEDYT